MLNVVLPPLRERLDDLPLLITHFRDTLGKKIAKPAPEISADAVQAMRSYRWPGNVRELENTLEQVFILTDAQSISPKHLPEKLLQPKATPGEFVLPTGGLILEDLEHDLIRQAIERSGGSIKEAAEMLGMTYKTMQYRLKKYDIDRNS